MAMDDMKSMVHVKLKTPAGESTDFFMSKATNWQDALKELRGFLPQLGQREESAITGFSWRLGADAIAKKVSKQGEST